MLPNIVSYESLKQTVTIKESDVKRQMVKRMHCFIIL